MRAAARALAARLRRPPAAYQCIRCAWTTSRFTGLQQACIAVGRPPRCPYCEGQVFDIPVRAAS